MSEVNLEQFFGAVNQLKDKIDEKHAEMHAIVSDKFFQLEKKLDEHAKEDRDVADRVLRIEVERTGEAKAAMKHGAIVALLVSTGLTASWHFLERLWK